MMSSMRATPPFHPPSEEEEVMGQDGMAWAKDERDAPKEKASPPAHDLPHPDEAQTIAEKPADIEWENVGPAAMVSGDLTHGAQKLAVSYLEICSCSSVP